MPVKACLAIAVIVVALVSVVQAFRKEDGPAAAGPEAFGSSQPLLDVMRLTHVSLSQAVPLSAVAGSEAAVAEVAAALATAAGLPSADHLRISNVEPDALGYTHYR